MRVLACVSAVGMWLLAAPALAQDAVPSEPVAEPAPALAPAPAPAEAPLRPAEFRVPQTDFILHFGGFARLDLIHDFNGMGSQDMFIPWTIPLDGSGEPNTLFDVRKSRLLVEARYPNDFADMALLVEVDFFTSSGAPRIRHAWGSVGRFLFGQAWTTFTNAAWIPPTLDFENPIGYVVQRNPQARYTQPITDGLDAVLSVEYLPARVSADLQTAVPGEVRTLVPDVILSVKYEKDGAYASLHGMLRNLFYDRDAGDREHHLGGAGNLILGYAFAVGHRLYAQAVIGNALGSYRGLNDFLLDADGEPTASTGVGGTLGAQVQWLKNRTLSTNIVGSLTRSLTDDLEGTDNGELATYSALNLVWRPIVYWCLGAEYLFGTYADFSNRSEHNHRLQVTTQATLP